MNALLPEVFGTGWVFLRLVAATGVSALVYAICCYALGIKIFREFFGGLLHRVH